MTGDVVCARRLWKVALEVFDARCHLRCSGGMAEKACSLCIGFDGTVVVWLALAPPPSCRLAGGRG